MSEVEPNIQVNSGDRFHYLEPGKSIISIRDIATSLSKECRFTGHCFGHYSVAQHSVLVSHLVPKKFAMYGLLHDASEAYTGDINKPLKELLGEVFKRIERRVQAEIYRRFGLDPNEPEAVHHADMVMLMTEKRDLMPDDELAWGHEQYKPLRDRIVGMEREEAYEYFMTRYRNLTE